MMLTDGHAVASLFAPVVDASLWDDDNFFSLVLRREVETGEELGCDAILWPEEEDGFSEREEYDRADYDDEMALRRAEARYERSVYGD